MTVKADSKGRLTGAQPETRYTRKEHPDGRIEYVPELTPFKPNLGSVLVVSEAAESFKTRLVVEVMDEGLEDLAETVAKLMKAVDTNLALIHTRGRLGALKDYMVKYNKGLEVSEYQ